MKIEKLTENKIRIIMNIDELAAKNIDIHSLSKTDAKSNSLFQIILEEAEKQVGFKVKNCKLLVEAFSTADDYIIFTLTKYKNELTPENSPKRLKFKRKSLTNSYKNAIYQFNNFEEFCNLCTYCHGSKLGTLTGLAKTVSLYEYNSLYYLVLSNINITFKNINLFYTSISEFSNLVSSSGIMKSKLDECGKIIFKNNAIKNGIKYFVNI